jgi:hypothetical protein
VALLALAASGPPGCGLPPLQPRDLGSAADHSIEDQGTGHDAGGTDLPTGNGDGPRPVDVPASSDAGDGTGAPDLLSADLPSPADVPIDTPADAAADAGTGGISISGTSATPMQHLVTSISVARPAGVQPGDMMWVSLYVDLAASNVITPPGWTLDKSMVTDANSTAWWFYRFATAGEPDSYSFTFIDTTGSDSSVALVAYRGVRMDTPIEAEDTQNGAAGMPPVINSLVTVSPDARVVVMLILDHTLAVPPTNLMLQSDSDFSKIFDHAMPRPGQAGPITFGCSDCGRLTLHAVVLTPN